MTLHTSRPAASFQPGPRYGNVVIRLEPRRLTPRVPVRKMKAFVGERHMLERIPEHLDDEVFDWALPKMAAFLNRAIPLADWNDRSTIRGFQDCLRDVQALDATGWRVGRLQACRVADVARYHLCATLGVEEQTGGPQLASWLLNSDDSIYVSVCKPAIALAIRKEGIPRPKSVDQ